MTAPISTTGNYQLLEQKEKKFLSQIDLVIKNLEKFPPQPTGNETNGSYYLFNEKNNQSAKQGVYKPRLQARGALDDLNQNKVGNRRGIPVGTEAFRERLAYALNNELNQALIQNNISIIDFGIPPTQITAIACNLFGKHHKTGSFQKFKKNRISFYDLDEKELDRIDKNELYKTAVIDMIFLNTDRHFGNLLYSMSKNKITLIDHGACFPELKSISDITFDWKHLSFTQSSFPENWINFITTIDINKIVQRILDEIKIHSQNFPKEQMEISGEAVFIIIYAIESLKNYARTNKHLPIAHYTTHLIRESRPFAIIKNRETREIEKVIELPIDFQNPSLQEKIYQENGFDNTTIKRQDIGGEFVKEIKQVFAEVKKSIFNNKSPTLQTIHQNLDIIQTHISSFLAIHPIRTAEENLLEKLKKSIIYAMNKL